MGSRIETLQNARGFTLVEALLIIAVMGILSAMALSRIDVARMQVNGAVQILSTTMVAAQREAVTKQHDLILIFDAANRRMQMVWDRNSNRIVDGGERVRPIPLDDRVSFGLGGAPPRPFGAAPINFNRVVNGLPALIFHRNGSASGVGGFYITTTRALTQAGYSDNTRAVEIVRATGRTEWFKYNGTIWVRGF